MLKDDAEALKVFREAPPPSFRRWMKCGFSRYSILRSLQYEAIEGLELSGKILDLGGGRNVSYLPLLRIHGRVDAVNISAKKEPALIADLNSELPLPSNSYDHVISLNTFEHLRNDEFAVKESLRVLKPGGSFHYLVPFLYQIHGAPSDYNRRTPHWWIDLLRSCGLSDFTIQPLVWDRLSSAFSVFNLLGGGPFPRLVRPLFLLWGVIAAMVRTACGKPPVNPNASLLALGFYISGKKPLDRKD